MHLATVRAQTVMPRRANSVLSPAILKRGKVLHPGQFWMPVNPLSTKTRSRRCPEYRHQMRWLLPAAGQTNVPKSPRPRGI